MESDGGLVRFGPFWRQPDAGRAIGSSAEARVMSMPEQVNLSALLAEVTADCTRLRRENEVLRQLVTAQDDLLVCYRIGNPARGAKAVDRITRARERLRQLGGVARG